MYLESLVIGPGFITRKTCLYYHIVCTLQTCVIGNVKSAKELKRKKPRTGNTTKITSSPNIRHAISINFTDLPLVP